MKIISINGRLETQGTWEETDAQAKRQTAGIVQQRAELRAMLSGNVAFHVDPWAAKPVKLVRLCLTDEAEAEHTVVGGPVRMHNLPKAKAAVKPPAVWRTAGQIPRSERQGLWFYSDDNNPVCEERVAMTRTFNSKGSYLKAPDGVASHSTYRHDLYQQPDADGWFAHDPQPDSVCPVPAGVEFQVRKRCGQTYGIRTAFSSSWQLGCPGDRVPHKFDIVAWRPTGAAA